MPFLLILLVSFATSLFSFPFFFFWLVTLVGFSFFLSPLFFVESAISLVSYREDIWATFPRQDEAMKYAKEHPHVRVFSYQDHMNGQRRFLVSTYEEFWRRLTLSFVLAEFHFVALLVKFFMFVLVILILGTRT